MAEVVISPPRKIQTQVQITPSQKPATPAMKKIDNQLVSSGTKAVGDVALEKALNTLANALTAKGISVSKIIDTTKGTSSVQIQDEQTGKTITAMPPEAAIQAAEKAKQKQIGLLIDALA